MWMNPEPRAIIPPGNLAQIYTTTKRASQHLLNMHTMDGDTGGLRFPLDELPPAVKRLGKAIRTEKDYVVFPGLASGPKAEEPGVPASEQIENRTLLEEISKSGSWG